MSERDLSFLREVIIYKEGRFISWSVKEKKPIFYNRKPSDFHKTLSAEYGPYSGYSVQADMIIAEQYGSTLGSSISPEEIIKGNNLGDGGQELSLEQILEQYVREGLSSDLPVTFGTIAMNEEAAERFHKWSNQMVEREIEQRKKMMENHGFKF